MKSKSLVCYALSIILLSIISVSCSETKTNPYEAIKVDEVSQRCITVLEELGKFDNINKYVNLVIPENPQLMLEILENENADPDVLEFTRKNVQMVYNLHRFSVLLLVAETLDMDPGDIVLFTDYMNNGINGEYVRAARMRIKDEKGDAVVEVITNSDPYLVYELYHHKGGLSKQTKGMLDALTKE